MDGGGDSFTTNSVQDGGARRRVPTNDRCEVAERALFCAVVLCCSVTSSFHLGLFSDGTMRLRILESRIEVTLREERQTTPFKLLVVLLM